MDKLKVILEQYRNSERGLPTYAELHNIAYASEEHAAATEAVASLPSAPAPALACAS